MKVIKNSRARVVAKIGVRPPTSHVWVEREGKVLAHVYSKADAEEIVAALNERDALKAEVARLQAAIERVKGVLHAHWDYQTRREAKFGRTGSSCVCDACNAMRAFGEVSNE